MNVLIINAHQYYEGIAEGKLNETMVDMISQEFESTGAEIKHTKLDAGYDIDVEIDKHEWADMIITQSPVYWFGTPWVYKKYIDEVFTAAYVQQRLLEGDGRTRSDNAQQYGSGGKMQGKKYMLSLTWNAPANAFGNEEQMLLEGKSVEDVFLNNTEVYKFCGAEILPPFSCFNVMLEPDIEYYKEKLHEHIALHCL